MRNFRFRWNRFELYHDIGFGADNIAGWSISWDGSFCARLEPSLFRALWIAFPPPKEEEDL